MSTTSSQSKLVATTERTIRGLTTRINSERAKLAMLQALIADPHATDYERAIAPLKADRCRNNLQYAETMLSRHKQRLEALKGAAA